MEISELKSYLLENEENFSIVSRLYKSLEIAELTNEEFTAIGERFRDLKSRILDMSKENELFLGELTFLNEFISKVLESKCTIEVIDYRYFTAIYSIINTIDRRLSEISSQSKAKSKKFEDMMSIISKSMSETSPLPPTNFIAEYDEIDTYVSELLNSKDFSIQSLERTIASIESVNDLTLKEKRSRLIEVLCNTYINLNRSYNDTEKISCLTTLCNKLVEMTYDKGVIDSYCRSVTYSITSEVGGSENEDKQA